MIRLLDRENIGDYILIGPLGENLNIITSNGLFKEGFNFEYFENEAINYRGMVFGDAVYVSRSSLLFDGENISDVKFLVESTFSYLKILDWINDNVDLELIQELSCDDPTIKDIYKYDYPVSCHSLPLEHLKGWWRQYKMTYKGRTYVIGYLYKDTSWSFLVYSEDVKNRDEKILIYNLFITKLLYGDLKKANEADYKTSNHEC